MTQVRERSSGLRMAVELARDFGLPIVLRIQIAKMIGFRPFQADSAIALGNGLITPLADRIDRRIAVESSRKQMGTGHIVAPARGKALAP